MTRGDATMVPEEDAGDPGWLGVAHQIGPIGDATDGQLLAHFCRGTGRGREVAFEVLIRRHGPLVLGRCRAILGEDQAADDAFQATFLVLARRAGQVRDADRLAPWLGRVARRVALRARREQARRRRQEERLAEASHARRPDSSMRLDPDESALVGAAVDGLAERDRLLVRLTYWQGKTYEEVADLLRWPVGTVRSRLHRIRRRLRGRLARFEGAFGAWLPGLPGRPDRPVAVAVAPPEGLVLRTVRGCVGLEAGGRVAATASAVGISESVAQLARGELAMARLGRWVVGGALVGVVAGAGGMILAQGAVPAAAPRSEPAPAASADPPGAPGLTNPGFEAGGKLPQDWSKGRNVPGVEYVWATDQAHGGKRSLGFRKAADRYFPIAEWSQWMPREGSRPRLRVVGWVRAERAGKAVLDVEFRAKDGSETHAWAAYIGARKADDPPATHDWRRYEGVVAIPDGTTEIAIAPQMYGPGAVWFDDLSIEYTDAPAIDPTKVVAQ